MLFRGIQSNRCLSATKVRGERSDPRRGRAVLIATRRLVASTCSGALPSSPTIKRALFGCWPHSRLCFYQRTGGRPMEGLPRVVAKRQRLIPTEPTVIGSLLLVAELLLHVPSRLSLTTPTPWEHFNTLRQSHKSPPPPLTWTSYIVVQTQQKRSGTDRDLSSDSQKMGHRFFRRIMRHLAKSGHLQN